MNAKFGKEIVPETLPEMSVESSDPEARKLFRQLRIQRRLEILEGGDKDTMVKTLSDQQLEESAENLTALMREGDEIVSNVRVASDSREVDRREAECANRQKVMEQLEEEAILGQEMFEEIANKWSDVFECNDPIYINEELELQKERCNELIKQKDALIEFLKDEVKKAEIKFAEDQCKQNEDIRSLGQRIEKQVSLMRSAFKEQLKNIEEAITAENQTLYDTNNRTWDNFYKKREKEELKQMRAIIDQIEQYHKDKKQIRLDFQEEHRASKIALAESIQNLQLMASKLKADVLLNQEMLDYNYLVLRKKEDENLIIGARQKRRINKLRDVISRLRGKIHGYDKESTRKIEDLTVEVKKLQARVVEMEAKATNLSKINVQKYNQLWNLNVEDTTRTLDKVLTIDRLIHEQQLGIAWQKPDLKTPDTQKIRGHRQPKKCLRNGEQPSVLEGDFVKAADGDSSYRDLLKHIMQEVVGKTDFLIEDRLQEVLEPFMDEEKLLVKIDNIFQAFRLKNVDDVNILFKFFEQYAKCEVCKEQWIAPTETNLKQISFGEPSKSSKNVFPLIMKSVNEPETVIDHALDDLLIDRGFGEDESTSSQSTESGKLVEFSEATSWQTNKFLCQLGHPLAVHPSNVMKALTEFVLVCNQRDVRDPNQQFLTITKHMTGEDVEIFWKQYRDAFSKPREQLWDGLLHGLKQYYEILKDRKQMNDEVLVLRKQNAELRRLLHSYTFDKQKSFPCESQRSSF